MRNPNTHFDNIRKSYSRIFAALERASTFLGIKFYLPGHLAEMARSPDSDGAGASINFFVLLKDDADWNEVVDYLTVKESFYHQKKEATCFYRRGSKIRLTPLKSPGSWMDNCTEI